MARYFIELAYNGRNYHGWQIQPGTPTVQEALNRALSTLLREEIQVVGAGRTDTGVHASFYVAHFDTCQSLEYPEQTVYKLNRILGKDIAVSRIYPVATDKHARFSAVSRTYQYFIDKNKNPFTCEYAWKVYPLPDIRLMNEACQALFEYRDFTSFSKLHTDVKTNNCIIMDAHWKDTGKQLVFTIKADRFLRNMVRAIVGTMVEIGQGKLTLADFRRIIESRNRCNAGTSVPGHALFLCHVDYENDTI
ncbi:MAG: tRNA pseudouridine(38-40) synthase TruA [Odoribacter sp.]|nr:tRNA pseudouridine(38-40) synthase TruA [Odoribacter sp.]